MKYSWAKGMAVGTKLLEELGPHCERCIVAGSLRREKAEVSDVEILYIPDIMQVPAGLFDTEPFNAADAHLIQLVSLGVLRPRPNVNGQTSWGKKNKLAVHVESGIPVDLFSTTVENWWVSLVVRTGSKETCLALTTGAHRLNRELVAYGAGTRDRRTGLVTPARSEQEVFALCGVPYVSVKDR